MRKIIFIEPYASVGKGHPYRNLNVIPVSMKRIGVDYDFLVENNIESQESKNIKRAVTPLYELNDKNRSNFIDKRKFDFERVIRNYKKALLIFLSNYKDDISAWISLFKDNDIKKYIINNDNKIIIHNVALYSTYYLKRIELRYLTKDLKDNLIFSFFTEHLKEIAEEICPGVNFINLIHPAYDITYLSRLHKSSNISDGKNIGMWLGGGNNLNHLAAEAVGRIRKFNYLIRMNPVNESNLLLYNYFKSINNKNIKLLINDLSQPDYLRFMNKVNAGVTPYDDYDYSVKASGLLEDFILCGVPVLVPEKTWLEKLMIDLGHGGLSFNVNDKEDFQNKMVSLVEKEEYFRRSSEDSSKLLYNKLSSENFIKNINEYLHTGDSTCFSFYNTFDRKNKLDKTLLRKGRAYYFTEIAEEMIVKGDMKTAERMLEKAIREDDNYWKIESMKIKLRRDRTCSYLKNNVKNIIEGKITTNPNYIYKILNDLKTFDCIKYSNKINRLYSDYIKKNYIYLDFNELLQSVKNVNLKILAKAIKGCLKEVELKNIKIKAKRLLWLGFIRLGEMYNKFKIINRSTRSFNTAIKYLRKDNNRDIEGNYNLASLYERTGKYNKAKRIFTSLEKTVENGNIKAGINYHLAVILIKEKQYRSAKRYLIKAVKLNPAHNKAKELLNKITHKAN